MKRSFGLIVSIVLALSLAFPSAPVEVNAATNDKEKDRIIITNESYDANKVESSGRFDLEKINSTITQDKNLPMDAYKIDMNLKFDPVKENASINKPSKILRRLATVVGSTKNFWVVDFRTDKNVSLEAKLLYSGEKSEIWVHDNEISAEQAKQMGDEFDGKIYPMVTQKFAKESDVDGNGKVSILVYDIQDGFNGSGIYTGGYFYNRDLYESEYSNNSEVFYIDTYPSMGTDKENYKVSNAFSTLAHEFQHLVNYNQQVIVNQGEVMDPWLDEAMSLAAEHMYSNESLRERLYYYERSNAIANGHSLLYWDENGDVLSNYSLSYLFGQYLRVQLKQGDKVFNEILQKKMSTQQALQEILNENFNNIKSLEEFISDFRQALVVNEDEGLFGFKGEKGLTAIKTPLYSGTLPIQLRGGGSVVVPFDDVTQFERPKDAGKSIGFRLIEIDGVDDSTPAKPELESFSAKDDIIKGYTAANNTITVYKDEEVIGVVIADQTGRFEILIGTQSPGTILYVTAKNTAGNESEATIITVEDSTPPEKPIVNEVTNLSTEVTGKAKVASTVKVTVGGKEIGRGTSKADGTFTIKIPVQKVDTVLSITATDEAGNVSEVTKVTVVDGTITEKATSRLGQIKSGDSLVYSSLSNQDDGKSSEEYKNSVYYIKQEATYKDELYYLLSTQPSAANGLIGWVKASDVTSYSHTGVDNKSKTFYIKGTSGVAYNRAWGGSENLIFTDLRPLKNAVFHVHKTEKVGNNTWYRGDLDGKRVWIHSNHLTDKKVTYSVKSTSRLAQIKSGESYIFNEPSNPLNKTLSDNYKNSVYFVKRQALYDNELYYLLSRQPSATKGVIGWVKASDVTSYSHVAVDNKPKTFFVKGTSGVGYNRAWGGQGNLIYTDLKPLKSNVFYVNKTEKVGNNTWYRGVLNGKTTWIHSNHVSEFKGSYVELSTSRLGQIKAKQSYFYSAPYNTADRKSTDSYKNAVYYIKKQATYNRELYYLLSTQPSATNGTIGWIKASDVTSYTHVGVDNKSKTFYVKGTSGVGYDRAWGGQKNLVYTDLTQLKDAVFHVHKTEKVGNNIWYRGELNGKRTWIHSNHLTDEKEVPKEQSTSRLAQIKAGESYIYSTLSNLQEKTASDNYKDAVYYIKKQATYNNELYYLLSSQPSATNGLIGWIKASDVTSYSHVGVDNKSKIFYVKGTSGVGYDRAWGGKKNLVFPDLTQLKGAMFQVHKTEKVGNNIWYRGELNGKRTWIHSNHLE